jgi:hypothetical protein
MAPAPVPALPTVQSLGVSPPKDTDPVKVAGEWLERFQTAISPSPDGSIDIDKVLDLFQPDAFWRDVISLTWDFRTFFGTAQIKTFLQDRVANPALDDKTRLNNLKIETSDLGGLGEDIKVDLDLVHLLSRNVGRWGWCA